jgi:hypothetical protein
MREAMRAFWSNLNTPDDFRDDPYVGGLNQLGHWALGAALSGLVCILYGVAFGVMPYKIAVWIILIAAYAGLIEWRVQKWQGSDSLVDTAFFALGVTQVLLTFSEFAILEGKVLLQINAPEALTTFACTVAALVIYIIPRAARSIRNDRPNE